MGAPPHNPGSTAVRLAFGLTSFAVDGIRKTAGVAVNSVHRIPVVGPAVDGVVTQVTARGDDAIAVTAEFADTFARSVIQTVVDAVAAQVDITKFVVDNVDTDAIADTIDLDRQVARVDVLKIADQVIEDVDLPDMIRESAGSMTTEAVHGARIQGMAADDAVAAFVGKLFGRDGSK